MDIKLLTLNIIFGSIVIYTYFKYLGGALQKGITSNQLWADIRGNYRNFSVCQCTWYACTNRRRTNSSIGFSRV